MLGEVMMKGRKGLPGLSLRRREWRVGRRFGAMVTLYVAEGVLTGITGTVSLSYRTVLFERLVLPDGLTAHGAVTS